MSKLQLFRVYPTDPASPSNRWIVDQKGLIYIQNHYENYKNNKLIIETCNRWGEFSVEAVKFIRLDFGGMCMENEPQENFTIDDIEFEVPTRQIYNFIGAFQDLHFIRNNSSNQLIIKSPKGKGNIVLLSEVEFKSMEETLYLLTNKKNREYLLESIQQGKDQKVTKIELIDLWK